MESPYSSVLIWYFYVHCNLALFGSEAQGSICEICPTNLASFLGFLGFFMDLLVQDSIWIYLFSLWPYGPIHSLWWWNLYSEGGTLHYTSLSLTVIVLHCWTKPHARRARPVQCAGWGCSLFEMATTGNYSNIRWRSSSFYGSLGFILLLCFWSTATYYFGICCQFSSNFRLWRNIGSDFWVLGIVSCGYNFPFKFTPIQCFWPCS